MKYVGLALGIAMVILGGLVAAQGNGWMDGPFDAPNWGILGALVCGLGVALVFTAVRSKQH